MISQPTPPLSQAVKLYAALLYLLFAALPSLGTLYLRTFINPAMVFDWADVHILAIAVATAEGLFITFITYRCYRQSTEPFLRWVTLAFGGFTLLYAPHGPLTLVSETCLRLFLIFGPLSRLVMAGLLLIAMLSFGRTQPYGPLAGFRFWAGWAAGFAVAAATATAGSLLWPVEMALAQRGLEYGALVLSVLTLSVIVARKVRAPLITRYFALAVACFAQASAAFLVSMPWNHLWWYAHGIFAAGFGFLSYGVAQAYFTTKNVSMILSTEDMIALTRQSQLQAERALAELHEAHEALKILAATDPLTGAANRRDFLNRAEDEIARAKRSNTPLSLISLDIDRFKSINDTHGHQVGDKVLKAVTQQIFAQLREEDVVGRLGGEEFAVLLPNAAVTDATIIAERLLSRVSSMPLLPEAPGLKVTASIGVAQWLIDGETQLHWFATADARLYQAKNLGRNRVVAS